MLAFSTLQAVISYSQEHDSGFRGALSAARFADTLPKATPRRLALFVAVLLHTQISRIASWRDVPPQPRRNRPHRVNILYRCESGMSKWGCPNARRPKLRAKGSAESP